MNNFKHFGSWIAESGLKYEICMTTKNMVASYRKDPQYIRIMNMIKVTITVYTV